MRKIKMTKTNLKCFTCTRKFDSKEDIYRNEYNHPTCQCCLIDFLENEWEDDYAEYILDKIKNKFNRNYNKWHKWFFENHIKCDEKHDDYDIYYEHKDWITVVDGKNYCRYCIDNLNEKEGIKNE